MRVGEGGKLSPLKGVIIFATCKQLLNSVNCIYSLQQTLKVGSITISKFNKRKLVHRKVKRPVVLQLTEPLHENLFSDSKIYVINHNILL